MRLHDSELGLVTGCCGTWLNRKRLAIAGIELPPDADEHDLMFIST